MQRPFLSKLEEVVPLLDFEFEISNFFHLIIPGARVSGRWPQKSAITQPKSADTSSYQVITRVSVKKAY